MIAKFPCILVLATWLSTSTQAVPLADFDAKKLLVARKNPPSRDTRAKEEATLRAIYGQSQRIQLELAAQQLHVNPPVPAPAPAPAPAELPEANPHVLIMRRSLYCLNHAASKSVQL
ncbi:hypothetical protein H0H93_010058 [Arthromyces matolae]|nr:hypothetical protein H0H93_010058 [Arthromyces matolae]